MVDIQFCQVNRRLKLFKYLCDPYTYLPNCSSRLRLTVRTYRCTVEQRSFAWAAEARPRPSEEIGNLLIRNLMINALSAILVSLRDN